MKVKDSAYTKKTFISFLKHCYIVIVTVIITKIHQFFSFLFFSFQFSYTNVIYACDFHSVGRLDYELNKTQYTIVTDENNDTKYYCQCGRVYNTLGSMRFHLSAECGKEFQCNFCDFRAARKSTLRNHVNTGKCLQRRGNCLDYNGLKISNFKRNF